jgi:hypothetical protein
MSTNIVQLPYQDDMEPLDKYRERRDGWRNSRGWITRPEPVPPIIQRARIAAWQEHQAPELEPSSLLSRNSLFAFANRRAS